MNTTPPAWYLAAQRLIGQREIPGPASNPTILGWAKRLGGWVASYFTNDDTPWCALFVNECLAEAGVPGTGALAARDFEKWGVPLEQPALGAICVFVRPGGGHVGFYAGETPDAYHILGGNQGNAVSIAPLAKSRCTAIRWPKMTLAPAGGRVYLTGAIAQPLSTNER